MPNSNDVVLTSEEVGAVLAEHGYLTRVVHAVSYLAADMENQDRYDDLVQCLRDALDFYKRGGRVV